MQQRRHIRAVGEQTAGLGESAFARQRRQARRERLLVDVYSVGIDERIDTAIKRNIAAGDAGSGRREFSGLLVAEAGRSRRFGVFARNNPLPPRCLICINV